jgi:argininosuccinate lyase
MRVRRLIAACTRRCAQGSQAYAKALAKAGVLTEEEAATIVEGLSKCGAAASSAAQFCRLQVALLVA